ncbi:MULTISPECIES: MMPL family transporter [unclassified Streptomyces]|uniref:MMPL family transporter n=1 Tax=unclassified Streptomyces TaxID=2593676 RepID=UPI001FD3B5D4|nr:MMPL family transporter [Streptomyces sp. So13.3]
MIAFWLVLVAVTAAYAGKLSGVEKNDVESSLPKSAESTQVFNAQAAFGSPYTAPAVIVYQRASGLTNADRTKMAADAKVFGQRTDLDGPVIGPIAAKDGTAAQVTVPLNLGPDTFSKAGDVVAALRKTAQHDAAGLETHIAGPAGDEADLSKAVGGIDTTLLFSTLAVVIVILLVTYRSPLLWLLPIVSAGVSLSGAQAAIYVLAKHAGLTVSADGAGILTILVFGATTDYSLLLIARYREELGRHSDRHEAMAVALRRSGPAIIASASTVAVGMICLMLADMNSTKGLGPVFAVGIVVGAVVMLTLFPALMVTVGRWIFWPAKPQYGTTEPATTGRWAAIGNRIARRPRLTWVVTALVLAATAVGIVQLNSSGLSNKEAFTTHQDSVAGETALAQHFEAGLGSPLVVTSTAQGAGEVRRTLLTVNGIEPASVTQPLVKGDLAYVQATLTDPPDSGAAYRTVDRVRTAVHSVPGSHAQVGGDTALKLDVERATRQDRNLIAPIVLAVVLLILVLLLRAVVAPLLLIATVVLSCAATLGVSALVFRHIFDFGAEDNSYPLYVFVFLIALGIDYNIFLMTRIREETAKHGTRPATLIGLAATGGVITSAGVVLAGTFAVLATLPLTQFAELGFSVAFGILLDTFIVRSVMVTALNLDIGRHIWWPHPLRHKRDEPVT